MNDDVAQQKLFILRNKIDDESLISQLDNIIKKFKLLLEYRYDYNLRSNFQTFWKKFTQDYLEYLKSEAFSSVQSEISLRFNKIHEIYIKLAEESSYPINDGINYNDYILYFQKSLSGMKKVFNQMNLDILHSSIEQYMNDLKEIFVPAFTYARIEKVELLKILHLLKKHSKRLYIAISYAAEFKLPHIVDDLTSIFESIFNEPIEDANVFDNMEYNNDFEEENLYRPPPQSIDELFEDIHQISSRMDQLCNSKIFFQLPQSVQKTLSNETIFIKRLLYSNLDEDIMNRANEMNRKRFNLDVDKINNMSHNELVSLIFSMYDTRPLRKTSNSSKIFAKNSDQMNGKIKKLEKNVSHLQEENKLLKKKLKINHENIKLKNQLADIDAQAVTIDERIRKNKSKRDEFDYKSDSEDNISLRKSNKILKKAVEEGLDQIGSLRKNLLSASKQLSKFSNKRKHKNSSDSDGSSNSSGDDQEYD